MPASKVLIILSGLPGSGKSYLAERLAYILPAAIVSSDRLRGERFAHPTYSPNEHRVTFAAFNDNIAWWLGQGQSVIADATNLRTKHVDTLLSLAYATDAKPFIFYISTPRSVREKRIRTRSYPEPEGTIRASEKMERYADIDLTIFSGWLDGQQPVDELANCVLAVVNSD